MSAGWRGCCQNGPDGRRLNVRLKELTFVNDRSRIIQPTTQTGYYDTSSFLFLQLKKKSFCRHTAGISGEFPAGPYDSVTRYENRNRICRNSTGNSPCTVRYSDNFRKFFCMSWFRRKVFPQDIPRLCGETVFPQEKPQYRTYAVCLKSIRQAGFQHKKSHRNPFPPGSAARGCAYAWDCPPSRTSAVFRP